jgi:hypothetical protein
MQGELIIVPIYPQLIPWLLEEHYWPPIAVILKLFKDEEFGFAIFQLWFQTLTLPPPPELFPFPPFAAIIPEPRIFEYYMLIVPPEPPPPPCLPSFPFDNIVEF